MGKPKTRLDSSSSASFTKPRSRTGDLGRAYDVLRDILPTYQSGRKKLTKIETLKLAAMYIGDLSGLLEDVKNDPLPANSPDVCLINRARRNSASSSEMSRSDSFYSLSSSPSASDYLYSPFSEYTAPERVRHPLCGAAQVSIPAEERAPYSSSYQFNSCSRPAPRKNSWSSDPWMVQNQPVAFRTGVDDSFGLARNGPALRHTSHGVRHCQWPQEARHPLQPQMSMGWNSAY